MVPEFYYPGQGSGPRKDIMKHTTVKISEIAAHPTLRLDPGYWLKKKKKIRAKRQAASYKLQKKI